MIYDYKCYNCKTSKTMSYGVNEEHIHPICSKCNEVMSRLFTTAFILQGGGWPSENIKIAKEAEKIEEIQAEGWRSASEMEQGMAMEKEHIEKRKKEGRLPSTSLPGEKKKGKEGLRQLRDKQAQLVVR